jgi:hypothetical protein
MLEDYFKELEVSRYPNPSDLYFDLELCIKFGCYDFELVASSSLWFAKFIVAIFMPESALSFQKSALG